MATRIPNYTPLYKKRVPRGIIKLIRGEEQSESRNVGENTRVETYS